MRHIGIPAQRIEEEPRSFKQMFTGVKTRMLSEHKLNDKENIDPFAAPSELSTEQVIERLRAKLSAFPRWLYIRRKADLDAWQDLHETFQYPAAPSVLAWMLEIWQGNWKILPEYLPKIPGENIDKWLDRCYNASGCFFIKPESLPTKEKKECQMKPK